MASRKKNEHAKKPAKRKAAKRRRVAVASETQTNFRRHNAAIEHFTR